MSDNKIHWPLHFWQIHKKVYNREWILLDRSVRYEIMADCEGPAAERFFAYVNTLAIKWFEDPDHNYNSRYRFQYSP